MIDRIARVALGALVLFVGGSLVAAESKDTWTRYFPDRPTIPTDEAGWAELARTFPNRVKRSAAESAATLQPPTATRIEVRLGIDYVRVRQLVHDLAVIAVALERPRLIVDLRYTRSELDESLQLGALLARHPFLLEGRAEPVEAKQLRAAGQITICLINRATSGPLEAVLDALQSAGDVLLVGTQSAGDTGSFMSASAAPAWRVIVDDYRRANGTTLLDVGVTPGLFVETTPDAEDDAYLALDAGRPIAELLDAPVQKSRFDEARLQQHFAETRPGNGGARAAPPENQTGTTEVAPAKKPEPNVDSPAPFDRSLQRAVGTLIAHDVLRGPQPAAPR